MVGIGMGGMVECGMVECVEWGRQANLLDLNDMQ